MCIAALVAQGALGLFHAHHNVGRLDDGNSLLALGETERLDGFVSDGADDLVAVGELERNMTVHGAFLNGNNGAHELVASGNIFDRLAAGGEHHVGGFNNSERLFALGKLEAMDGQVWLDEREDVYCVWRTEYSRRSRLLDYYVDIFSVRADGAWERSFEEHRQRWYSVSELTEWLTAAGFGEIRVYGDCRLRAPNETDGRIYISCIRKE